MLHGRPPGLRRCTHKSLGLLSGGGADAAAEARYQEQLAEWKQRQEALRKQRKEARKARAAASAQAADEERAASDSSDDRSVARLTVSLRQRRPSRMRLPHQSVQSGCSGCSTVSGCSNIGHGYVAVEAMARGRRPTVMTRPQRRWSSRPPPQRRGGRPAAAAAAESRRHRHQRPVSAAEDQVQRQAAGPAARFLPRLLCRPSGVL